MTPAYPEARGLAGLSLGLGAVAIVGSVVVARELGVIFALGGLLALAAAAYGLWFGRTVETSAASAVLTGLVALATMSGDPSAGAVAALVAVTWSAAAGAHLSLTWRVDAIAPAVRRSVLAQHAGLLVVATAVAYVVMRATATAPERTPATQAAGVTAALIAILLATAAAARRPST